MQKKVNMGELRVYCEETAPQKISFCTENQSSPVTTGTMLIHGHYSSIHVFDRRALVCLSDNSNMICFQCVKYALIDTDSSLLGTLITLRCGYGMPEEDVSYTLIVA